MSNKKFMEVANKALEGVESIDFFDPNAGAVVTVSWQAFYEAVAALEKRKLKRIIMHPEVLPGACLVKYPEEDGSITYGFEDISTGEEIDFIFYHDMKVLDWENPAVDETLHPALNGGVFVDLEYTLEEVNEAVVLAPTKGEGALRGGKAPYPDQRASRAIEKSRETKLVYQLGSYEPAPLDSFKRKKNEED